MEIKYTDDIKTYKEKTFNKAWLVEKYEQYYDRLFEIEELLYQENSTLKGSEKGDLIKERLSINSTCINLWERARKLLEIKGNW